MQYFPPALEKLVEQFARLPGIGRKTAQRLAFFVLSLPEEDAAAFADAIVGAKAAIHCCPVCQNFSEGDGLCPSARIPSGTRRSSAWWPIPRTWWPWSAPGSTPASTTCSTG